MNAPPSASPIAPAALAEATANALGRGPAGSLRIEPLAGAGSDRTYWRIVWPGASTCLACWHEGQRPENDHFAALARLLEARGVRVPRILGEAPADRLLWVEDLGDTTLFVHARSNPPESLPAYRAAVAELARFHAIAPANLSPEEISHLQPPFDEALYRWEQDYFLDHFGMRHSGLPASQVERARAHPALVALAARLAALPRRLVHRDFQSQNILLLPEGRAALVDFQGMRLGRPEYDLASLVHDPYTDLDTQTAASVVAAYRDATGRPDAAPDDLLRACAQQRLMQALGAYCNLADNAGKTQYLRFITPARARLRMLVAGDALEEAVGPLLDASPARSGRQIAAQSASLGTRGARMRWASGNPDPTKGRQ